MAAFLSAGAAVASAPAASPSAAQAPSKPLAGRILEGAPVPSATERAHGGCVGVDGSPTTLGVSLSAAALDGLPAEPSADDTGWLHRLPLPTGLALPPFDHVGLYWNPHGHEPHGVYDVAHFDGHFFMSAPADLDRITVVDRDLERAYRLPPVEAIPAPSRVARRSEHELGEQ